MYRVLSLLPQEITASSNTFNIKEHPDKLGPLKIRWHVQDAITDPPLGTVASF